MTSTPAQHKPSRTGLLMRRTLLYMPAQILGSVSQLAATVLWTHWLTPAEVGIYALVWVTQELLFLVGLSWWTFYTLRYMTGFEDPEGRKRFARVDFLVIALTSLIQALACTTALSLILHAETAPSLAATALAFTLTRNLTSHFSERARARNDMGAYTVLQATGPLGGLVLGLLAVAFLAPRADALLGAYALAQAAGLAAAWARVGTRSGSGPLDRSILAASLVYGLPLLFANMLAWVTLNALRLIVEHTEGLAAVGLVSVGWWLGQRAASFASLLVVTAAFPFAVEQMRESGREQALPILAASGALLLALLAPFVAGAVILAPPFAAVFVAAPFQEVTAAVLPLAAAFGAVHNLRIHVANQAYLLFERPSLTSLVSAVSAGLTVIGCWFGLRWGGLTGAVAGCLAAELVTAALTFGIAMRLYGLYLRLRDIAGIAAATIAMTAGLLLLPDPRGSLGLALHVVAGAAIYALALVAAQPSRARALLKALSGRRFQPQNGRRETQPDP